MTVMELSSVLEQAPRDAEVFVIGGDGRKVKVTGVWRSIESEAYVDVAIVGKPFFETKT